MEKVALKPVNIKLCQDDIQTKSSDNKSIEYKKGQISKVVIIDKL